jgi:seryl-tRNA synthetase
MKETTYEEAMRKKGQAERFVRNVLGDDGRADEIADESVESYASRKRIAISNPRRSVQGTMAGQSKADLLLELSALKQEKEELEEQVEDLEETNESLNTQLDQIFKIASPEDDNEEEIFDEGDTDEE